MRRRYSLTAEIFRANHLEVMRHLSDCNYIPKWKKARKTDKLRLRQCTHPDCEVTSLEKLIKPSFQSLHRLKAAIRIPQTCDQPFVACQRHYHQIYKILTAPTPCACCGAKPKFQLSITDTALMHTQFVNISMKQLGLGALYNQMITFVTPATNST